MGNYFEVEDEDRAEYNRLIVEARVMLTEQDRANLEAMSRSDRKPMSAFLRLLLREEAKRRGLPEQETQQNG